MSLSQRRVFIGSVIEAVIVKPPASTGRQTITKGLSRLEIHCKDGDVIVPEAVADIEAYVGNPMSPDFTGERVPWLVLSAG